MSQIKRRLIGGRKVNQNLEKCNNCGAELVRDNAKGSFSFGELPYKQREEIEAHSIGYNCPNCNMPWQEYLIFDDGSKFTYHGSSMGGWMKV